MEDPAAVLNAANRVASAGLLIPASSTAAAAAAVEDNASIQSPQAGAGSGSVLSSDAFRAPLLCKEVLQLLLAVVAAHSKVRKRCGQLVPGPTCMSMCIKDAASPACPSHRSGGRSNQLIFTIAPDVSTCSLASPHHCKLWLQGVRGHHTMQELQGAPAAWVVAFKAPPPYLLLPFLRELVQAARDAPAVAIVFEHQLLAAVGRLAVKEGASLEQARAATAAGCLQRAGCSGGAVQEGFMQFVARKLV